MVDQLKGSCCKVWRTGTRHWTQTTTFMQFSWTLQKPLKRVHHDMLLSIIAGAGAKQSAQDWFRSYLSGRTICTRVLDALSPNVTVMSEVPQGSVLRPLLFLVYFKDIPASTDAQSAFFADDRMLYRKDCLGCKDIPCCSLQFDLIALSRCVDDHHVLCNGSKSAELPIGARPRAAVQQSPFNSSPVLKMGGKLAIFHLSAEKHSYLEN